MPFLNNGLTTGLLGYKLRKEFLGDGLYYREVETYHYDIYSRPDSQSPATSFTDIQNNVKNAFAGYSGDINVKLLDIQSDYFFPNDSLRVAKFSVEVEGRKAPTTLAIDSPELGGNYYKGFDSTFFSTYCTIFKDFQEDFSFEVSDNGNNIYSHNLNFTLISGGKNKATEIASFIYPHDKDTTLGISVMAGGVIIADTGNYLNYYSETYDLIKNSFSFSKKREVLPFSSSNYLYTLSHSLVFKEDGIIDVTEKGNVQGKTSFNDAVAGASILMDGSYARCNDIYNTFDALSATTTLTETLNTLIINSNRILNRPAISVDYDITYSNDPNVDQTNFWSLEKVLEVEMTENRFININHSYNFTNLSLPSHAAMDVNTITGVLSAISSSTNEIANYYSTSAFFDPSKPNMKKIKQSSTLPNRKKSYNVSISYSNNPIYFFILDGVTYSIFDFKVNETEPVDIINEYKIINRPTKMSVINYAYQTEKGTRSFSINARLQRSSTNTFTSPVQDISTNLSSLYTFGIGKLMERFFGSSSLAFTYHLSDLKYSMSSENEIGLEMTITYTIKKYKA